MYMFLIWTSALDQDQYAKGHMVTNTWTCCVFLGTHPAFSGYSQLRDLGSPLHPQMDFLRCGKDRSI